MNGCTGQKQTNKIKTSMRFLTHNCHHSGDVIVEYTF